MILKLKLFSKPFAGVLLAAIGFFFIQSCGLIEEKNELTHGSGAPVFTLPDAEGNEVSFEDLNGHIVLLNFWASWCQPCRRKNPEYMELHNKYKDSQFRNAKGFVIVSVSLDEHEDRWLNAIKQQNLNWDYHLSDLLGNRSPVVSAYQVTNIPQSFLIDHDGQILGRNLEKREIARQLEWRMAYN